MSPATKLFSSQPNLRKYESTDKSRAIENDFAFNKRGMWQQGWFRRGGTEQWNTDLKRDEQSSRDER